MPGTAVVDVVGAVLDHVEVVLDFVAAPVELATVHSLVSGFLWDRGFEERVEGAALHND